MINKMLSPPPLPELGCVTVGGDSYAFVPRSQPLANSSLQTVTESPLLPRFSISCLIFKRIFAVRFN